LHTLPSRTLPPPRTLAAGVGLALLLLAAGAALAARPVHAVAPNSTVTSLADAPLLLGSHTCVSTLAGGDCTLRAAIDLNEASGGGGAITLNLPVPGAIKLTLGQLTISQNVSISGAGLATNAVVGDGKDRVFAIDSTAQVTLSGFTITDGRAPGGFGGGIANAGALTLSGVDVQNNSAAFGGGIVDVGTLTLQPGTIVNRNSARFFGATGGAEGGIGGGIAEYGKLTATGSTFSGNTADDSGGNLAFDLIDLIAGNAVTVSHGRGNVTRSTITEGSAVFGAGAWIFAGESATFTASTFVNNSSTTEEEGGNAGGAIESECGALTLTNDTLAGNDAAGGFGGAIAQTCFSDTDVRTADIAARGTFGSHHPVTPAYDPSHATVADTRTAVAPSPTPAPLVATAAIDFVTMADNTAGVIRNNSLGSTIANQGDASTITVHDTIVAKKSGDPGKDCVRLASATTTTQGYNLESANDCSFTATGDQTNANPQLGALATNGGPTQTMALTAGTPAVDSADPKCDVTTDQRGVSRPQGPRCDIGAFELQVATTATPTPLPSPPVTGQGRHGADPSFLALVLALLAIPLVGAGLLIARRRTA
jgi:hypothetical protein